MNRCNTEISLNSYLPFLLNGLRDEGVNIHRNLKKPILNKLDLYSSDSYIRNSLLVEILVTIKRELGLVSFYEDFIISLNLLPWERTANIFLIAPIYWPFCQNV